MTVFTRLDEWKERGVITPEQHAVLAQLSRGEPSSVFLELNALLYVGILAFVGGLGLTVSKWSEQMGDVLVVTLLSAMLGVCCWYSSTRAGAWSREEAASPNLIFDCVLYLGGLIWLVELTYLEKRFHLLGGEPDLYFLLSACLFFVAAYRFDNRFLLSLGLSSLAGWFGLTVSHWSMHRDEIYRQYAVLYGLVTGSAGAIFRRCRLKAHFFGTYLNLAANVLFWAVLSGVFQRTGYGIWLVALLALCGAALGWGLPRREFSFVAYAAVYGYVGLSAVLVRNMDGGTAILSYFVFTGVGMLVLLVQIARRFGREE